METGGINEASRDKFLIIGCSGAIGLQLAEKLIDVYGDKSVIAALHRTPLPEYLASRCICEFGFNILDNETIVSLLAKYSKRIRGIWNLAAPLSVDTAKDPTKAHDITVGGMHRLLEAMRSHEGLNTIYFSDSIGSYGYDAPRENASVEWLVNNPSQDPGSDYGIQKREIRELLARYHREHNFDCRFAIIPGVLHTGASWGGGTTEYALDALHAASKGEDYVCPVPETERLPMIHSADLIEGLVALMTAPAETFPFEKLGGVPIAGFSFSPSELFSLIVKKIPSFQKKFSYDETANPSIADFSKKWPNSLDASEAASHINFCATRSIEETVDDILAAHHERMMQS